MVLSSLHRACHLGNCRSQLGWQSKSCSKLAWKLSFRTASVDLEWHPSCLLTFSGGCSDVPIYWSSERTMQPLPGSLCHAVSTWQPLPASLYHATSTWQSLPRSLYLAASTWQSLPRSLYLAVSTWQPVPRSLYLYAFPSQPLPRRACWDAMTGTINAVWHQKAWLLHLHVLSCFR